MEGKGEGKMKLNPKRFLKVGRMTLEERERKKEEEP